jgi:hypothetical protein
LSLKPNQRRPDFDDITAGWGSDNLDGLVARCELLPDLLTMLGGWTDAEQKIVTAMRKRLEQLGGLTSTTMQ